MEPSPQQLFRNTNLLLSKPGTSKGKWVQTLKSEYHSVDSQLKNKNVHTNYSEIRISFFKKKQDQVKETEYKLWNLNIIVSQLKNKNGTKSTPIILKSKFNT